ncbi:MAG TPA: MBL fold metallo-hydrolase [Candidatus Woesebacteria bacterium]|nr:MBL fold metallo-hydrolase [Candidatus Woesebacteria bacterium]
MKKWIAEELAEKKGRVTLVRVLLRFWLPFKKYPNNGVWSYILQVEDGVVVFDVGAEKGVRIKKTKNVTKVMEVVEEYFPGQKIREILLSHYHYDHAGGAPLLQKMAKEKWGYKPLIRIHKNDCQIKKIWKVKKSSLVKLFEKSGVKDWEMGRWLRDGERIRNSDWTIKHTPGHTSGTISLVNGKEKIVIGGWLNEEIENRLIGWLQGKFIDEDKSNYCNTRKVVNRLKCLGYQRYYLHPMIKKGRINPPSSKLFVEKYRDLSRRYGRR